MSLHASAQIKQIVLVSAYPTVTDRIVTDWRAHGMDICMANNAEMLSQWLGQSAVKSSVDATQAIILPDTLSFSSMLECIQVLASQHETMSQSLCVLVMYGSEPLPKAWQDILPEHEQQQGVSEAIQHHIEHAQSLKSVLKTGFYSIQLGTLSPDELRVKLALLFHYPVPTVPVRFLVESFGFKYGVPTDAHWVLDARFVPNPYYEVLLREQTGRDTEVQAFMDQFPSVHQVMTHWEGMFQGALPDYQAQGKREFKVAIGCTGGQHRSVYLSEQLAQRLAMLYPHAQVVLTHREQNRWPKSQN